MHRLFSTAKPDMCKLRNYRPGDETEVLRIVQETLAEYGLKTNPEETDADLRDIRASYLLNGGAFRILDCEGHIAGCYGLYPSNQQSCELRKMYLLSPFKGQGLGKQLMDDALQLAVEMGFVEMTLETNSRLTEALGMYRKYGFSEFNPAHRSDRCNLSMRRDLVLADTEPCEKKV